MYKVSRGRCENWDKLCAQRTVSLKTYDSRTARLQHSKPMLHQGMKRAYGKWSFITECGKCAAGTFCDPTGWASAQSPAPYSHRCSALSLWVKRAENNDCPPELPCRCASGPGDRE